MIPLKDDNPPSTVPFITIGIIAINILIFLYELSFGRHMKLFLYAFGAVPFEILHNVDMEPGIPFPVIYTVLTSMFIHAGIMHLAGNMLYLWIFGFNIEDRIGHTKFAIFYIICGIIALTAHMLTNIDSHAPMVGASGAVSGILGAYMVLFPRSKIVTLVIFGFFIRMIKLPAVFVIGIWIFIQVINGMAPKEPVHPQQVAWFAHIGGFLAGMLLIKTFQKRWLFSAHP